jgi:hypothetical protein
LKNKRSKQWELVSRAYIDYVHCITTVVDATDSPEINFCQDTSMFTINRPTTSSAAASNAIRETFRLRHAPFIEN